MAIETAPLMFKTTVEKYGARTAMRKKEYGLWQDISWNAYYEQAGCVGAALISMGLENGDCVSIIGDNCPEWVIIDMGVQCAGGTAVGVYATNAWPQVEYVIGDSDSKFFFVENEEQLDKWLQFRDKVPRLKKVIVWDLEGLRHFEDEMVMTFDEILEIGRGVLGKDPRPFESRMAQVAPEDVSMLIYTSGTTGPPKGAMLTHRNLMWMGQAITTENPMDDEDEVLSFLPLCHVFEQLFSVMGHITHGYTVNFIENLETVTDNMIEISPTVGYAVPRIWEKYLSAVYIRMSDATWFKKLVFGLALKTGKKRASLMMDFKPVPGGLEFFYNLAHFVVFRKLKERMGFDRMRIAYSGAAPHFTGCAPFFSVHWRESGGGVWTDGRNGGDLCVPCGKSEIRYRGPPHHGH